MDSYPTATQKPIVGQEMPNRPDHDPTVGLRRIDQDLPPKASTSVLMVPAYSSGELVPTATQNRAAGQDTPRNSEDAWIGAAPEGVDPETMYEPRMRPMKSALTASD
jgi:hypothetical protein